MEINANALGKCLCLHYEAMKILNTSKNEVFSKIDGYTIRVGWWVSKVGENGVKWKIIGIETAVVKKTAVVKGFSPKSLFWKINFSPKNAYLRNEQE